MDDSNSSSIVECIAGRLGFNGECNPEIVIKEAIAKKYAITEIELLFNDDKREVVITAKADSGKLFSQCVTVEGLTSDEINLKFWDTLQECENFMAGEYLRW